METPQEPTPEIDSGSSESMPAPPPPPVVAAPAPPLVAPAAAAPPPPPATPAPAQAWQAPDPEAGPAPGVEFAGPGARLVGYIIDNLLISVVIIGLFIVGLALAFTLPIMSILPFLAIPVVYFVYFPYFWAKSGQTPGQRMMGIKVVRDIDGGPVSMGSAILRLIGYFVSSLVFYLGYIWIFVDKRKRGWFDLIAGTVVIKTVD